MDNPKLVNATENGLGFAFLPPYGSQDRLNFIFIQAESDKYWDG